MADTLTEELEMFSQECLKIGCLKGFKYFNCYLRGREELVVTVHDTESTSQTPGNKLFTVVSKGHPPASPCEREAPRFRLSSPNNYVFLIATYARYGRPMVWLRSNNNNAKFQTQDVPNWASDQFPVNSEQLADLPLKLFSIESWPSQPRQTHIWDVISELVHLCISPTCNPFALNWNSEPLISLPRSNKSSPSNSKNWARQLFATAGLISQLQLMAHTNEIGLEYDALCDGHFELMKLIFDQQNNN
eukprot:NODE_5979_length_943_cov_25.493902_g5391_i0.p1 GENE.NODE_5979_length_943_cov_25.493902_g5391_i0~~NODE_5979_length_943_cov_25.493902_g5391_i0.p1  ORF type:complete len:266 (-),score=56.93 NODE_5979_length_943_cov_25.493902_g5391_i0:146-886(-)